MKLNVFPSPLSVSQTQHLDCLCCFVFLFVAYNKLVSACSSLCQIRSVRRSLPRHALLSIICPHALVVSKVDYCNSVLAGISGNLSASWMNKCHNMKTRKCAVDYDTTAYRRSDMVAWCFKIFLIGLLSSVPPLARWRCCVPIHVCPLLILWQRVTFGGG